MSDLEILNSAVEYRWAWDWDWTAPQEGGRVIGVCNEPQVCIERPDGTQFWWRKDLTRPTPSPNTTEDREP